MRDLSLKLSASQSIDNGILSTITYAILDYVPNNN